MVYIVYGKGQRIIGVVGREFKKIKITENKRSRGFVSGN